MKRITYLLCIVTLTLLPLAAFAGNLDSPGDPTSTAGHMPTLQEMHDYLTSGAEPDAAGPFQEPASGPATGTMYSLQDIYDAIKALFDQITTTAADVRSGKQFFSTSPWGIQSGAMPEGEDVTGTDGELTMLLPEGYYMNKTATAQDPDLTASNIANGVDIFGVTGDALVAAGNVTADQVLVGATFSNTSSVDLTGTMPNIGQQTITPGTMAQTISQGYHDGTGSVDGDADLVASNIKSGVNIFGVTGTYTGSGGGANVLATGQITSYATGDDGDLQKGVAWPNPRFTDNGDGTVTDNLTGLIWLRMADCVGKRSWANALTFANSLSNGSCGLTDSSSAGDWRLPNRKEFESLLHLGNPALPNTAGTGEWSEGDPFTGVQLLPYWSSTTPANYPYHAWYVNFKDGLMGFRSKTSYSYVWPVRGGQ